MLQEIKERVGRLVNFETASDNDLYYMSKGHINWLIKRAEEAEKLTRIAIEADEGCEYWKDKYKQAQAKAERYKNHLLYIQKHYGLPSEPTDFVPVTVLHEIQMIVSNALEGES